MPKFFDIQTLQYSIHDLNSIRILFGTTRQKGLLVFGVETSVREHKDTATGTEESYGTMNQYPTTNRNAPVQLAAQQQCHTILYHQQYDNNHQRPKTMGWTKQRAYGKQEKPACVISSRQTNQINLKKTPYDLQGRQSKSSVIPIVQYPKTARSDRQSKDSSNNRTTTQHPQRNYYN